ncbi:MAG: hypothetical protein KJ601_04475 [Nanoarchaeota archaeon]|nr:hypothetical protein [Nanoarchaeota archaeon]MBU1704499.1 hypothetical protein [Nanoarchaeota archaeon]
MGHTVWSQRIVSDIVLNELKDFGKALREDDRHVLVKLLKEPLKHLGSISYANSIDVWAFLLLSILIEQEKKIEILNRRIQEGKQDNIVGEREREEYSD